MPDPSPAEEEKPWDGPTLPRTCPSCGGTLATGFVGTNGRVFWSEKKHFIGVFGDEPLISLAMARTTYVRGVLCRRCGFVGFLSGSQDEDDAMAIVDDAMNAPEDTPPPPKA
jgi:uncharacterized protein DUF6487